MICDKCGHDIQLGEFPFCKGDAADHGSVTRFSVIGDDIPGGMLVPHAICHPDGTPKRYYTKSSMAAAARAKGWVRDGETPKRTLKREV